MTESEDYDVVIDVLSKHRNELWKMTERNMRSEYIGMNIMDDIRLKQIEQIDRCIAMWKKINSKERNGYSDLMSDGGMDPRERN